MNKNEKTIFQRLQGVEDELAKLGNIVFALKTTDITKYHANYADLSTDAALRAERMTCLLRNLVYISESSGKADYMRQAANAQDIRLEMKQGILSIFLPGLLPKRKVHTNTAFLHEPLNFALQEYLKEHTLPLFQECVICFSQVYDENLSLRRIRDYDNLEFKQILDTISTYVLRDDTALFCDSYHTTEMGTHDRTIVYIMEKSMFSDWVKNRQNHIETISEIL
ncbi:MAG: DUF6100 family protein [Lachnospiraceae bacterium]|nr:DUF6100 family protein [Lachnospiraceae bacterium]